MEYHLCHHVHGLQIWPVPTQRASRTQESHAPEGHGRTAMRAGLSNGFGERSKNRKRRLLVGILEKNLFLFQFIF